MIADSVLAKLNEQIQKEFQSSYYYLAMAAWSENQNLSGAAHFFRVQAKEEWGHGMKIFDYILERGGEATLEGISKPYADFKSLSDIFHATLEHERKVTKSIEGVMDAAQEEKDYATVNLLSWFIDEQIEEENTMETICARIQMGGADKGPGLLMLDAELGRRAAE